MQTDAIVLRRIPWREHDQLVVLYSRQFGKTAAIARGSLRASSRQAPALDDGNHIVCRLVPGRSGTAIMTGAQAHRAWAAAKGDGLRWAAAQAILQAVDALCFDGQPDAGVWDALTDALHGLDRADAQPVGLMRRAQAALLAALGHGAGPLPPPHPGRSALDDACERIAERALDGPSLVYCLARPSRAVLE